MHYLLFGSEILLIVAANGLVPARSELRTYRSRVSYNEPGQANPSAPSTPEIYPYASRHGFSK
jgi:hypothetical protein